MKLTTTMEAALNQQLHAEFESHYIYLAMAAKLSAFHMLGAAAWMRIQAEEELGHAMKMYDFIEDRGGAIILATVEGPATTWTTPVEVFKAALAHEEKMSRRFDALVDQALAEKDHSSNNLIQWFVAEQVEEESTLTDIIAQLELVGNNGTGLLLIDRELGGRPPAAMPPA